MLQWYVWFTGCSLTEGLVCVVGVVQGVQGVVFQGVLGSWVVGVFQGVTEGLVC